MGITVRSAVAVCLLLSLALAAQVDPASGTLGTLLRIEGAGFGARGKAWLEYDDAGKTRKLKLKVAKGDWTDGRVTALLAKAKATAICDVVVAPKGREPTRYESAFEIRGPAIESATSSGRAGEVVVITGRDFGAKSGKVYLLFTDKGKAKKAKCKVSSWTEGEIRALGR